MVNHLLTHDDSNTKKDGKKLKEIMLSETEWEVIIDLLQVLGPIEEVTTCLGGSKYVTYSLLFRLIQSLKQRFRLNRTINNELNFEEEDDVFDNDDVDFENQEDSDQHNINTPVDTINLLNLVKKNMYQALCYYFPTPTFEKLLPALLDPRCKKLEDFDNSIRLNVENKLRELYKELETENKEKENQIQEGDDDINNNLNTTVNLLYVPSLLKSLDKEEVAQDEVEEYLDLPQIGINNDPLVWWKLHSKKFPILSELSRVYLAVAATSTPSERLFSDAGNLLTNKRTRILPELFKRMIFLKRNINNLKSIHPPYNK